MSWRLDAFAVTLDTVTCLPPDGREEAMPAPQEELADICLRLELSAATVLRLLTRGELCAADLRCLDCASKDCVWRLLLLSAERTLHAAAGTRRIPRPLRTQKSRRKRQSMRGGRFT